MLSRRAFDMFMWNCLILHARFLMCAFSEGANMGRDPMHVWCSHDEHVRQRLVNDVVNNKETFMLVVLWPTFSTLAQAFSWHFDKCSIISYKLYFSCCSYIGKSLQLLSSYLPVQLLAVDAPSLPTFGVLYSDLDTFASRVIWVLTDWITVFLYRHMHCPVLIMVADHNRSQYGLEHTLHNV